MTETPIDRVRGILAAAEDVDLPEGLAAPQPESAGEAAPESGDWRAGHDDAGEDDMPPPPPPDDGDGGDWDAIRDAAAEPLNDYGNGRRFAIHHGRDLRWVPRVGWHVWDSTRWARDNDLITVRARAHTMGRLIALETAVLRRAGNWQDLVDRRDAALARQAEIDAMEQPGAPEKAELKALLREIAGLERALGAVSDLVAQRLRHAKNAGNTGPIDHMIQEGGIGLATRLEDLDADPLQLNLLNGTLQFTVRRDGKVRRADMAFLPHDPAHMITKLAPVSWDPAAGAPRFRAFLNQIQPDPEMQGYLQRLFGLSALALVEQMMAFFYGDGANGKSVLVDLMARILGDYAASAKIESLTGSNRRGGGDATPDLVPMIGARMVRASEPEKGVSWQEGLIKELTGGEPLLIRALHSDFVEARVFFTLIVTGNHKPEFKGTDDGIWRRVKLVPFTEQIPEPDRIPKAEMDEMLFAEASGVLNWLVEGILNYLEAGLMEPAAVRDATRALREESDPYGAFLDECCVVTGDSGETGDRIGAAELVNAFNYWLTARGEGQFRDRTVARAMADHARRWRSRRTGQKFTQVKSGGRMTYDGLRFTDFFKDDWDRAPKDQRGRALAAAATTSGSPPADDDTVF